MEKLRLHGGGADSYKMDGLGRLVRFERPNGLGALKEQKWTLDNANNWASTNRTVGSTSTLQNRAHNANNELTSIATSAGYRNMTYDANGNLLEDDRNAYKWDFKNRLREVRNATTGNLVAEYWYDVENRRHRKTVGTQTTLYFRDGMNEVQESDCLGLVKRQYVYGRGVDELVAIDRPVADSANLNSACAPFVEGGPVLASSKPFFGANT